MTEQEALRQAIGLADCCELMAATWGFPDERLCEAFCDGSYESDARLCLKDAGMDEAQRDAAMACLAIFAGARPAELLAKLKRGHSLLYLAPGAEAVVWPYEAPFRFVAEGREGVPTLFRAPVTLDVERHMREAGVLPKDARREPSDSVWDEFSFLAYLYGNVAAALEKEDEAAERQWRGRIGAFCREHALRWLPDFMARTREESADKQCGCEYAALSRLADVVLGAVAADVRVHDVSAT